MVGHWWVPSTGSGDKVILRPKRLEKVDKADLKEDLADLKPSNMINQPCWYGVE